MESPSIMDNTTVVGGAHSNIGDGDFLREPFPGKMSRSDHDGKLSIGAKITSKNLRHTPDYLETERPFFIKIGKDGLISALQKLDQQLQKVRGMERFVCAPSGSELRMFPRVTRDISCLARSVLRYRALASTHGVYRIQRTGLERRSLLESSV